MDDFFIGDEGVLPQVCASCGRLLGDDPEAGPPGDAGGPICDECGWAHDVDAPPDAQGSDERARDRHDP